MVSRKYILKSMQKNNSDIKPILKQIQDRITKASNENNLGVNLIDLVYSLGSKANIIKSILEDKGYKVEITAHSKPEHCSFYVEW